MTDFVLHIDAPTLDAATIRPFATRLRAAIEARLPDERPYATLAALYFEGLHDDDSSALEIEAMFQVSRRRWAARILVSFELIEDADLFDNAEAPDHIAERLVAGLPGDADPLHGGRAMLATMDAARNAIDPDARRVTFTAQEVVEVIAGLVDECARLRREGTAVAHE